MSAAESATPGDTAVSASEPAPVARDHVNHQTPGQWWGGRLFFWAFVGFIAAYVAVLSGAMFVFQFGMSELPCPLCILQRMAMMLAAIGPVYIVAQTLRGRGGAGTVMTGIGLAIIGAILGMMMSTRQILLHIAPDDPGYGEAILGLHLYTWALVSFVVVLVFCGLALLVAPAVLPTAPTGRVGRTIAWIVIALLLITILLNAVVVFVEAGWNWFLPDDPTEYLLFAG